METLKTQYEDKKVKTVREDLGILGGGQLAFFLAQAANRLGYTPVVLTEESSPSAKQAMTRLIQGTLTDVRALRNFFNEAQQVVFENEWVDIPLLRQNAPEEVRFLPPLDTMERLQDKLIQKEELLRLGIPTAPFRILDPKLHLASTIESSFKAWQGPLVLKWSRQGYDGKGVLILEEGWDHPQVKEFCTQGWTRGAVVYAEPKIPFEQELALVAVRSEKGNFFSYPLVVSEQREGTCVWILGKAKYQGIDSSLEQEAARYAESLAFSMGIVGTFALEFFLSPEGTLLVNEISPRVHNSGHYTLEASEMSQFEAHLRAILGLELKPPQTQPYFAMLNLLGPEGLSIDDLSDYRPKAPAGTYLHWYGKKSLRPKRKMGHITLVATSDSEASRLIGELERWEQSWKKEMETLYEQSRNSRRDCHG